MAFDDFLNWKEDCSANLNNKYQMIDAVSEYITTMKCVRPIHVFVVQIYHWIPNVHVTEFYVSQNNRNVIIVTVNNTPKNDLIYLKITQAQRIIKVTPRDRNTVVINHLMCHLYFVVYSDNRRIIDIEINEEPIHLAVIVPNIYTVDVHKVNV